MKQKRNFIEIPIYQNLNYHGQSGYTTTNIGRFWNDIGDRSFVAGIAAGTLGNIKCRLILVLTSICDISLF